MSRIRLIFNSKLRSAGIASIVCVAAVAMSGCVSVSQSGGVSYLTLWKGTTNTVMLDNYGPTCNQDVDRDGTKGTSHDRALCSFFIIRTICNGVGGNLLKVVCYAVTDPNMPAARGLTMADQFIAAAGLWSGGGGDCLLGILNGKNSGWTVTTAGNRGCG